MAFMVITSRMLQGAAIIICLVVIAVHDQVSTMKRAPDLGAEKMKKPDVKQSSSTCSPSLLIPPAYSKLEFIHIPKTGGTAAEVVAASHNVSWGACHWLPAVEAANGKCPRRDKREHFHHPDWLFSSWHVPIQYYNTPQHPNLFQWYRNASLFAIVRNPYDRMVSEWNYARIPKDMDRNNATAMNEYLSLAISSLQSDYKWWKRGDHWVRQVEFVSNVQKHGGPEHVYILHFEALADEFACLMQTFDMIWTWPTHKSNPAHGRLTVANLTERTKSLIASHYAADFEQFGYNASK